jgi:NAD(P)-dependent dehydrogenase (short-subunit alcohol dehydrogenase family)
VLHKAGATVVATARAIPADTQAGVHYIAADITTAAGCATVAHGLPDRLGGIDILVNVLGGSNAPAGGFAALDDEAWAKELNLNLMAVGRRTAFQVRRTRHTSVALAQWTCPFLLEPRSVVL